MNYKSLCACLMLCGTLFGCATNRDYGAVIGGASGAILGNQIGGGVGRVAATAIGAVAGSWVGSNIGSRMDEQDRERLYENSQRSVETGDSYSYYNPRTGVRSRTSVVDSSRVDSRECRTVRQTIIRRDGREEYEDVRTCRTERGWDRY